MYLLFRQCPSPPPEGLEVPGGLFENGHCGMPRYIFHSVFADLWHRTDKPTRGTVKVEGIQYTRAVPTPLVVTTSWRTAVDKLKVEAVTIHQDELTMILSMTLSAGLGHDNYRSAWLSPLLSCLGRDSYPQSVSSLKAAFGGM